jgi:signal peptidase I
MIAAREGLIAEMETNGAGPPVTEPVASTSASDAPPGRGWRGPGWLREVVGLVVFIAALAAARSSLADHYHVPTGSMIPTVAVGDHVIVNKLAYGLRVPFAGKSLVDFAGPRRGDVVVLDSPEDGITLLKRVVAVPGDMVEVQGGMLTINGSAVPLQLDHGSLYEALGDSPHLLQLTHGGGYDFGPVVVGKDKYLVMGDNRGESHDGRAFGLVERHAIFGRALAVWMREGGLVWKRL